MMHSTCFFIVDTSISSSIGTDLSSMLGWDLSLHMVICLDGKSTTLQVRCSSSTAHNNVRRLQYVISLVHYLVLIYRMGAISGLPEGSAQMLLQNGIFNVFIIFVGVHCIGTLGTWKIQYRPFQQFWLFFFRDDILSSITVSRVSSCPLRNYLYISEATQATYDRKL